MISDVLTYMQNVGMAGSKLTAVGNVDPANVRHVQQALAYLLGGDCGLELPLTAQDQLDAGQPWDVTGCTWLGRGRPNSWGGHSALAVDFDANYVYFATWARIQPATWAWFATYCDEFHVGSAPDEFGPDGTNAAGLALPKIRRTWRLLGRETK